MYLPSALRVTGLLAAFFVAMCAVTAQADSLDLRADDDQLVVAQASETAAPTNTPGMDHGHDAPAETSALPNPKPQLNKKRVAFWGVIFMTATSVAFVIFGAWAMRRAPKPGQQRPG